MGTNDPLIIRNATIDDAPAIGSMVDEFRSYLQALGDVHAPNDLSGRSHAKSFGQQNPLIRASRKRRYGA